MPKNPNKQTNKQINKQRLACITAITTLLLSRFLLNYYSIKSEKTASSWQRKEVQLRRARHAGHCWRSKDELISDVLLWTPTYGRAKAGRPARTCIQQLCEVTGYSPEDLPEVMNDREKWRERVRDIRASGTTWWWWWWLLLQLLLSPAPGIMAESAGLQPRNK